MMVGYTMWGARVDGKQEKIGDGTESNKDKKIVLWRWFQEGYGHMSYDI